MEQLQSKNVLYVIPGTTNSGGVYVALQHVNHLKAIGVDVYLYSLDDKRKIEWFDNNVHIYTSEDLWMVMTRKWDVVVATQFGTARFVMESLTADRKIYFVQSDERRFTLRQSDMSLCVASYNIAGFEYMTEARWIVQWLKDEFNHDCFYVPNGVDHDIFYRLNATERSTFELKRPRRRKRVLLEGAINNPEKGMLDAYNAVKDLDVDLWIVSGDGVPPDDWKYDQFFQSVPIVKMREIYGQCDLFVKMSRVEGFFGPPLEAMACGLPVIVGKCTGYDEYIVDGKNALVVETGDVTSARLQVQKLLEDDGLRLSLVQEGLRTASKWTWAKSFEALESILCGRVESFQIKESESQYDYHETLQKALRSVVLSPSTYSPSTIIKRDFYIEEIYRLLENKSHQLELMQNSKFWKLRTVYLQIKDLFVSDSKREDFHGIVKGGNSGGEVPVIVKGERVISDTGAFSKSSDTLIILVHYDPEGIVDPYFLYYLKKLHELGDVCIVSASEKLDKASQQAMMFYAKRLIVKNNVGYDFKAWARGISKTENLDQYDRVILTNDSVFGPFSDLEGIVADMDKCDYDVWSIADSFQRDRYHLQSYFMVYNMKPLRENFLRGIFEDFSGVQVKDDIIDAFEVGLTDQFDKRGYKYGAYASMKNIPQTIDYLKLDRFRSDGVVNSSHALWDYLIMYENFPFLKRELVMKNPLHMDLSLLYSVIHTYTDYDVALIDRYRTK